MSVMSPRNTSTFEPSERATIPSQINESDDSHLASVGHRSNGIDASTFSNIRVLSAAKQFLNASHQTNRHATSYSLLSQNNHAQSS